MKLLCFELGRVSTTGQLLPSNSLPCSQGHLSFLLRALCGLISLWSSHTVIFLRILSMTQVYFAMQSEDLLKVLYHRSSWRTACESHAGYALSVLRAVHGAGACTSDLTPPFSDNSRISCLSDSFCFLLLFRVSRASLHPFSHIWHHDGIRVPSEWSWALFSWGRICCRTFETCQAISVA